MRLIINVFLIWRYTHVSNLMTLHAWNTVRLIFQNVINLLVLLGISALDHEVVIVGALAVETAIHCVWHQCLFIDIV